MKNSWIIGSGILGIALATAGFGVRAETTPDKFAPLRAALASKKQEAVVGAEDARFWAEEYDKFLKDPETGTDEKPDLRKTLSEEQAREKKLRQQSMQIQAAIRHLRAIPDDQEVTLSTLHEAYSGLSDLAERGKAAWDQLLSDREIAIELQRVQYRDELAQAVSHYEELRTTERANELLLKAIDSRRLDASDAEFHVALKLPPIKLAVELGFGIPSDADDPNRQAQTTLIALIGYSQFFWDHHAKLKDELSEAEAPSDLTRNILGIADGKVLTSDAIVENKSNLYYLSDAAKERFNRRIRAIWGSEGTVAVSRWDQNRAKSLHRACEALSTVTDRVLMPDPHAFELLDEIDAMIEERENAIKSIEEIHGRFQDGIANARKFGENVTLSSAHYNAGIWAGESSQTIARFEAAQKLLENQLNGSSDPDWTPNTTGIIASVQTLRKTHRRYYAIKEVREELLALLQ